MTNSDSELLRQYLQQGSQAAFREIVERHTRLVYAVCHRTLGDQHLAEDATQQVFTTLWQQAADLEFGRLSGYLAKMADFISRRMLWHKEITARTELSFHQAREEDEQVFQKAMTPMRSLTWDTRVRAEMELALEHLPDHYRRAVTLHHMEGLDNDAVAEALNISGTAARKRVTRGVRAMRRLMEREGFACSVPLIVAALRQLRLPAPANLAARVCAAALSPNAPVMPYAPAPRVMVPFRIASGIAAALTLASVLAVAIMPRTQQAATAPSTPPAMTAQTVAPPPAAATMTFDQQLHRKMRRITTTHDSFQDEVWFLSFKSGVPIDANWDTIAAAGVDPNTTVAGDYNNMSVLEMLDALIQSVGPDKLEYVISHQRIVVRPRPAQVSGLLSSGG